MTGTSRPHSIRPVTPNHRAQSLHRVEHRLPFYPGHAVGHPLRCRLALEPMTEPLIDAPMIIDLVLLFPEAMILPRIDEHHEVIAPRAPSEVVELDALVPIDRAVGVAEFHQHWRLQLVHFRSRGVADVRLH